MEKKETCVVINVYVKCEKCEKNEKCEGKVEKCYETKKECRDESCVEINVFAECNEKEKK